MVVRAVPTKANPDGSKYAVAKLEIFKVLQVGCPFLCCPIFKVNLSARPNLF